MKAVTVDALLALGVLTAWLGALGFARLRRLLDRLHCATFVASSTGPLLALAALLDDGVTVRSVKLVLLVVVLLATGAAASHAVGRAVYLRDGPNA